MITLKIYNKNTLDVLFAKDYGHGFTIFETSIFTTEDLSIHTVACAIRLLIPSEHSLEELLDIIKDEVIIEASDDGGTLIRILCSLYNYKLELSDESSEVIFLNIHEKIFSWDTYNK